ncbi:MAG: hypothetical protein PHE15_01640 [Dehalococcoidales bacterium]|nr:hypothetical protein [Dehalococcoidales bacterium]
MNQIDENKLLWMLKMCNITHNNVVNEGGESRLSLFDLTDVSGSADYTAGKVLRANGTSYTPQALTGVMIPLEITGATAGQPDYCYVANNASQVVITLPATAVFGSRIAVIGKGAGGWKIAQNAGQTIHYGEKSTATGTSGYIEAGHFSNCIEIMNITANTDWKVVNDHGAKLIIFA